uniref:hypothetical protein n=1 Tax=uncultured Draconibacterium sp. TaxID=1573823 RepID=UPI003217D76E
MINIKYPIFVLLAFLIVSCSEKTEYDEPDEKGYVAPEPPEQVLQQNVFQIRLFSNYAETTLFSDNNYSAVANEIASDSKVYVNFLDRADAHFLGGNPKNPTVDIARQTKRTAFFIPGDYTSTGVNGTGVIINGLINEYKGQYLSDNLLIAGPEVRIMASQSFMLNLAHCRISNQKQNDEFVNAATDFVNANLLIVGVIKKSMAKEFEKTLRTEAENFRLQILSDSNQADYVPFVFGPLNYVLRDNSVKTLSKEINSVTLHIEALQ